MLYSIFGVAKDNKKIAKSPLCSGRFIVKSHYLVYNKAKVIMGEKIMSFSIYVNIKCTI